MKKVIKLLVAAAAVIGGQLFASIGGSKHDFQSSGWTTEICKPCHTPHEADLTVTDAPLWNHEVSVATYTPYDSPTMDVTMVEPGPVSKLCLSCHDGTVALDSFGGGTGSNFIPAGSNLGTDLSDDHPIGITWTHQTILGTCNPCHFPISRPPETMDAPFFSDDGGVTYKVECASCHDVHNSKNNTFLLQIDNTGSALCLYCHVM